jgi:hypothetical protein
VVIKRNVSIPSLLKNFMDFGFDCIQNDPVFAAACSGKGSLDTIFSIDYRKYITNASSRTVSVKLSNRVTRTFPAIFVNAATTLRTHEHGGTVPQSIRTLFNTASKHVKSVKCDGPFIDYLLHVQRQTIEYLSIKLVIVAYEMLLMNKHGVDSHLFDFMTTYNSGFVYAVARHAQKPGNSQDGFKIAWHRDTAIKNHHKGMVTTGLYIHRSNEMTPESGGISFAKGGKEVRLFPESGTVVSFLDQHIVHKVIPIRLNHPLPPQNHGFVKRSAVFISWHTTNQIINSHPDTGFFRKAGIKHRFRNLKKLYLLLHKYFLFIKNKHGNLQTFINHGPSDRINNAYRLHGGTNYSSILAEGGYPQNTQAPVANLILYKVKNSPTNNTPRKKLQNLRNVYTNLYQVFGEVGAGKWRTNKTSLLMRRGGRVPHTTVSSGFVRNI